MSGFKDLLDISNNFENELGKLSTELFSAKIDESFEDVVAKKMRDITLLNSKLKLLQAKTIAVTPQVTEVKKDEQKTISDYADTARWKVIEQQTVKTSTQSHAAKDLITSATRNLDPEFVERMEKIIDQLQKYGQAESELQYLKTVLQEKQDQLWQTRQEWDETLSQLKDRQKVVRSEEYVTGPLHKKLQALASKTKLIRCMLAQLATCRAPGGERRMGALVLARRED